MSELAELIEINKNIERQNDEIIRLLKKIAGEGDAHAVEEPVAFEEVEDNQGNILDVSPGVGEVYFIDEDIFRLSIKNNEVMIDNLTGDGEPTNFAIAELIANESIERNQSLNEATVILTASSQGKLPQTINLCVEEGAKRALIPWNQTVELLGAPQELQMIIKLDLYRNEEHLIQELFNQ